MEEKRKKKNSTELQKPKVEAEVYINNRSVTEYRHLAIPQTAAHQAPLFIGFSRQESWSRLPFPSPIYIYTHKQNANSPAKIKYHRFTWRTKETKSCIYQNKAT